MKLILSAATIFTVLYGLELVAWSGHIEYRSAPTEEPQVSATKPSPLGKMLTDPRLWGEDAFEVLGSLDRWRDAGETSVLIYPDRVVGGTRFEKLEEANQKAKQIATMMKRARAKLRPSFAAQYRQALAKKAPPLEIEAVRFPEDDSFRVMWRRKDGSYLRKGLTMRAVLDAYGPPEKTTREVVQSRGERRPTVLITHWYANGAVNFVESDMSPTPGFVDRAVVHVRMAAAQIFLGPR